MIIIFAPEYDNYEKEFVEIEDIELLWKSEKKEEDIKLFLFYFFLWKYKEKLSTISTLLKKGYTIKLDFYDEKEFVYDVIPYDLTEDTIKQIEKELSFIVLQIANTKEKEGMDQVVDEFSNFINSIPLLLVRPELSFLHKEGINSKEKSLLYYKYYCRFLKNGKVISPVLTNKFSSILYFVSKDTRKQAVRNFVKEYIESVKQGYHLLIYDASKVINPKNLSFVDYPPYISYLSKYYYQESQIKDMIAKYGYFMGYFYFIPIFPSENKLPGIEELECILKYMPPEEQIIKYFSRYYTFIPSVEPLLVELYKRVFYEINVDKSLIKRLIMRIGTSKVDKRTINLIVKYLYFKGINPKELMIIVLTTIYKIQGHIRQYKKQLRKDYIFNSNSFLEIANKLYELVPKSEKKKYKEILDKIEKSVKELRQLNK